LFFEQVAKRKKQILMKKLLLAIGLLIAFSGFAQIDYNTISGSIRIDADDNGCSLSDTPAISIPIKIMHGAQSSGTTFCDGNGNYTFNSPEQNITVMPQFDNPYYHLSPESFTCTFQGLGNSAIAGFCILPNGTHEDVEISIVPVSAVRPGFDALYKIVYKNKGTTTIDGNITFNYNENLLDFVMASPQAVSTFAALNWTYSNLKPFETREIALTLNVNSPMETPAVNIGDIVECTAHITPEDSDEASTNNHTVLSQTVTGSYDPNEKSVSSSSQPVNNHPFPLQYTIRFQNTGNEVAEDVVITDLLSDKLDINTLQMVFLSHPCHVTLAANKIEFAFDNINLPAASVDEPNSHGYVSFQIRPIAGIQAGDVVLNQAKIYFDFNFPITTNPVSTVFYNPLATEDFEKNNGIKCYPNPVQQVLKVETNARITLQSARIYNTLGQLVQTVGEKQLSPAMSLDVSALQSGSYLIEMVADQGKITKKFIKL